MINSNLKIGKVSSLYHPWWNKWLAGSNKRKGLERNFYLPVYKIPECSVRSVPKLFIFSFLFIMYSIDQPLFWVTVFYDFPWLRTFWLQLGRQCLEGNTEEEKNGYVFLKWISTDQLGIRVGSSHRRKSAACPKFDMVWLYRSRIPVGRRGVIFSFKLFIPAFATLRGGGGDSAPCGWGKCKEIELYTVEYQSFCPPNRLNWVHPLSPPQASMSAHPPPHKNPSGGRRTRLRKEGTGGPNWDDLTETLVLYTV